MAKTIPHRFLLILIFAFAVSYGLLGYFVIERQARMEHEHMLNSAERTADIVSRILKESMLEGDPKFTRRIVERLRGDVAHNIFVLGRKRFGEPDMPISREILDVMSRSGRPYSELKNDRFYYYMPLTNEQRCLQCHKEEGLLGVILVDRSVASEKAELRSTLLRLAGYGLFLMLIGIAALSKITTYYIINPLRMIGEAIQSYSKQDFSKRISSTKLKGEFSAIANTVNSMAERLSSLYGLLEEKIHKQNLELKGQLDFVEMLINSINSGIIFVGGSGIILKANPYTVKALEADEKSIIGKHMDDFVVGFYDEILKSDFGEGQFKLNSGRSVYLGYSVSEIEEVAALRGKVVLFRDLTEVMLLRSQLRRKEYFSTIGEMASWIAHEIKNPLFGMSASAEILLKTSDEYSGRFIEAIIKECRRLDCLIDDLLQYAKPVELKLAEADLPEIVSEVMAVVDSVATSGGCRLVLCGDGGIPKVRADGDKVKQVFLNIMKNSIEAKATEIDIGFLNEGDKVTVRIKDNGTGIDTQVMENIFKPFYTTKKKGTGLGLSICKKIIEEHGGSMAVYGRDGGGTSVDLTFKI